MTMNIFETAISVKKGLLPEGYYDPSINTEVFIERGKNILTLVVGESWSWGDSMGGDHLQVIDNFEHRINNNLGIPIVEYYDTDFCLAAIPGNNNTNIKNSLRRLLNTYAPLYEKIICVIQVTERARDSHMMLHEFQGNLPNFYHWYDSKLANEYIKILENYDNISFVFWRNFTKHVGNYFPNMALKTMCDLIVDDANLAPVELPIDLSPDWWKQLVNKNYNRIVYDDETTNMITKEVELCTKYMDLFCEYGIKKYFVKWHPNEKSHRLLGNYLRSYIR